MRRFIVACLVLASIGVVAPERRGDAWQAQGLEPPGRDLSWLHLGDSYGAGEGATDAAGHCQRSQNASGPKAAAILRDERGWRITSETFSACTGHLVADVFSSRDELSAAGYQVYGKPVGKLPDGVELTNAQSLSRWTVDQRGDPNLPFDVITASLSGNDIGFADVVTGCLQIVRTLLGGRSSDERDDSWEAFAREAVSDRAEGEGCDVSQEELETRIRALVEPVESGEPTGFGSGAAGTANGDPLESLQQVYTDLADRFLASGGVFVVMGYPRLVTPSQTWGRWRGGMCNFLSTRDADLLGRVAVEYDRVLREAVEGLGARFVYVSRLEIFDDGENYRSLCGRGVEWLNTPLVFLRDGTGRPERGFHPNDLGYLATAEAVAGVVENRLGDVPDVPDPTTGPPPTVRSSEPRFDVGEPFAARCTIAWPTAPQRGVDSIQMRTTCPGVPDQFLFVDIVYADPDLPVTPSRSTMYVEGEIIDIARSELGFTVLAVHATYIQLE